jgi:hypothetical protein
MQQLGSYLGYTGGDADIDSGQHDTGVTFEAQQLGGRRAVAPVLELKSRRHWLPAA